MPAPTTYRSRELVTLRDGLSIYSQLFTPTRQVEEPLPVLLCAHGFGANYLSCVPYAWALVEEGFAVCCLDFSGGGYASKSEGNPLEMTLLTEVADIAAVMEKVVSLEEVDPTRVFLLGEGQGGVAAVLFADAHPDALHALLLVHPTLNMHDQARQLFPTKKNIPASYRQLGMRVGRAYGKVAWDTNPYAHMQEFQGEVLILHGNEDATVPLEYAQRATTVYANARLEVIRHGKHVFKADAQTRCMQKVCDFLCEEAGVADLEPVHGAHLRRG